MGDPQITYEYSSADPSLSLSSSASASPSPSCVSEGEDAQHAPPLWRSVETKKPTLSKQLSMREVPRNIAWERRRRQFRHQERRKNEEDLTDEDLNELKGCIELGFGFNAEEGQRLCTTIPALDLYFAVNRQFLTSPLTSPSSAGSAGRPPLGTPSPPAAPAPVLDPAPESPPATTLSVRSCSFGRTMGDSDSWKILNPGDDPQQVKTKLRHWAQAVACSVVMQSPIRGGGMD